MKGWVGLVYGWSAADGNSSDASPAQDSEITPAQDRRSTNCATQLFL